MIKSFTNSFRNKSSDVDRWNEVGGLNGLLISIKSLGQGYRELNTDNNWRQESSVWGRVIQLTTLKKQDENARKWLYTVWRVDRRSIRSVFYEDITSKTLPTPLAHNVRNI
ncbi:unnamed protein product [Didymodactylos carnosus]|uniref:Uncharacterized protein n=1 Tax=Didymodactylos carnosus TaxID=1234261 RepID=A0A815K8L8_9BILA|nr:unnamed protein product [Didymodactylos carnosus]CAF1386564.1 unnamed protein product [Didymodactylos carnosus]CAF3625530.1 unnamed protein product [Didymodactylos carnosus]CAF4281473.1 unnamed protein product [Didymodactylos carnosus]